MRGSLWRNRVLAGAVVAATLAGTAAVSVTPAAAWCRWGGCGFGWGAPLAAGVVAGTVAGAALARPYPAYAYPAYAYPPPYVRPGGYFVCPRGYHFGPGGRACFAN